MALPVLGSSTTESLADFKGKVVVLNVFASWCEPCAGEAPLLAREQHMLVKEGATLLGVTYLDNSSASEQFDRHYHITYPVLRDVSGNFVRSFGTTGVPETFVINRAGRIQALQRYPVTQQWLNRTLPPIVAAALVTRARPNCSRLLLIARSRTRSGSKPGGHRIARLADPDRERRHVRRLPRAAVGRAVAGGLLRARLHPPADRPGPDREADREPARRQYGPSVLAKPPAHGFNLLIYVLPPLVLVIGVLTLVLTLPKWRRRSRLAAATPAPTPPPIDPEDERRLDEDLARHRLSYIESGALTPSNPSASAITCRALCDSAIRNDSTSAGCAPITLQSR